MSNQRAQIKISPIMGSPAAKWAYSSLIYSLFFFLNVGIHFSSYTAFTLFLCVAIYAIFILLYILATKYSDKGAIPPIAGIIIISALGTYINPGTNALYGYAAFLAAYYFNARIAWLFIVFNLAAQFTAAWVFDIFIVSFLVPSITISIGLFIFGRFSQREFIHQTLQAESNEKIEQLATIAERERIARDMHDLLGHSLSSLALKAELAEKLLAKDQYQQAEQEVKEIAEIARESLAEIRQTVTDMKQKGLAATIDKLSSQLRTLGFNCNTKVNTPELSAKTESTLIMCIKEAVTNILRHSDGDHVLIEVATKDGLVTCSIKDNGKLQKLQHGNGLDGMQSRVNEAQGRISIEIENGVAIFISLPIQETKQ